MTPKRNPEETQAWLVGGGIASLAAAVHLLNKANVPADQIHILDIRHSSGGSMKCSGNCVDGYVLHTGALPYLRGQCVADLLSMVPSAASPTMSYLQDVKSYECYTRPINKAHTRAIKRGDDGLHRVDVHQLRVGAKIRGELVRFLFDGERCLDAKQIDDIFDDPFFESEFWALWSTTFLLQPWHSAIEFHRLLVKHLPHMHTENDVRRLERTQFSLYESLIFPITAYLRDEGVNFHFHTVVTDIKMYPGKDPKTVEKIILTEHGEDAIITVSLADIVIVTLGSLSTGWKTGSNDEHPQSPSPLFLGPEWTLWQRLHEQSPKFGNPDVFSGRIAESTIETFTITLREADFFKHYCRLTQDKPGTGALLTVLESPWGLNISVPHQPVFGTQPNDIYVVWGYALNPDQTGEYVPKPMRQCSGREILLELLSHLGFPTEQILASATTIPCLVPLGTSMLVSRKENDRPRVVPHGTTNIAFVGQYVEIPGDTTFGVEYSVRGAAMAVHTLMGSGHGPPAVRRSRLLEVFDLLC